MFKTRSVQIHCQKVGLQTQMCWASTWHRGEHFSKFTVVASCSTTHQYITEIINVINFRDNVSMYDNARSYVADDVITWLDRFGNQNFLSPAGYIGILNGSTLFARPYKVITFKVKVCHGRFSFEALVSIFGSADLRKSAYSLS